MKLVFALMQSLLLFFLILNGVVAQNSCGNEIIEPPETCESNDLSGCGQVGFWACKNCQCSEYSLCGDDILQPNEDCEKTLDCPVGNICYGCICAQPTISYSCDKLLNNGDSENKINIFFMDENYGGRKDDYKSDIQKYLYGEIDKKGLFNVSPFKDMKDRFNVYVLDSNGQESDCSPELGCKNQQIVDYSILSCGLDRNVDDNKILIAVLDGENDVAKGEENILVLTGTNSSGRDLRRGSFLHELGHLFGFGEEYLDVFVPQPRTTYPPNLDSEGCPNWCSGLLNPDAPCYTKYQQYKECIAEIPFPPEDNIDAWTHCLRIYEKNDDSCNLGLDCEEDSGCWFGGESVSDWRAYNYDIMKGGYNLDLGYGYGKINEDYIGNKIESLTEINNNLEIPELSIYGLPVLFAILCVSYFMIFKKRK